LQTLDIKLAITWILLNIIFYRTVSFVL